MSSRDRPRDDDLEERLDELEDVLSELRADLRASERDRWLPGSSEPRRRADPDRERGSRRETDRRRDRSSDLPRPPRLSELVRFTEQYTIPTVIALLETTIKSLKLVQGTLRLLDPEGTVRSDTEATAGRLADVRDGATDGLARSLSELRTALAEADLPEETASRSIIEDARELTADIESRIEESRRRADDARRPDRRGRDERGRDERGRDGTRGDGSRRDEGGRSESSRDRAGRDRGHDGAVHIDVTDPDERHEGGSGGRASGEEDEEPADPADDRPEVDVESELDSIKRQLDAVESGDTAAEDAADGSNDDEDRSANDGSDDDPSATGDDSEK